MLKISTQNVNAILEHNQNTLPPPPPTHTHTHTQTERDHVINTMSTNQTWRASL